MTLPGRGDVGVLSTGLSFVLISVHDQSRGKPAHASATARWECLEVCRASSASDGLELG